MTRLKYALFVVGVVLPLAGYVVATAIYSDRDGCSYEDAWCAAVIGTGTAAEGEMYSPILAMANGKATIRMRSHSG